MKLPAFLRQEAHTDDIQNYPNWRVGASCATSWAWGVSIAVGMAIMQTKGLLPFFVWTAGNILALPLFAIVRTYLPASKHWLNFTPLFLLFVFVEYFAITLNLQAIQSALGGGIDISSFVFIREDLITPLVLALGLFIVWYINRWGLKGSILTDVGQYAIQMVGVILLAGAGFLLGERNDLLWIAGDGQSWMVPAFLGIITGALATGHQWHRFSMIKEENILRVGLWGGLFFGVYMFFVFLSGLYFNEHIVLGAIFLVIILSVATSTIDSSVAGLQFIAKRFKLSPLYGSLLSVVAIGAWPFVIDSGLTSIWTFMAAVRYPVVLSAIALTLLYYLFKSDKVKRILERSFLLIKE